MTQDKCLEDTRTRRTRRKRGWERYRRQAVLSLGRSIKKGRKHATTCMQGKRGEEEKERALLLLFHFTFSQKKIDKMATSQEEKEKKGVHPPSSVHTIRSWE